MGLDVPAPRDYDLRQAAIGLVVALEQAGVRNIYIYQGKPHYIYQGKPHGTGTVGFWLLELERALHVNSPTGGVE